MSKIEWTEKTWNVVTGCTKVSQGCKHCYADRMTKRLQAMGQPNYVNDFQVTMQEHMHDVPLKLPLHHLGQRISEQPRKHPVFPKEIVDVFDFGHSRWTSSALGIAGGCCFFFWSGMVFLLYGAIASATALVSHSHAIYTKYHTPSIWVALCRRTRQIVAYFTYFIGDHSAAS